MVMMNYQKQFINIMDVFGAAALNVIEIEKL